MAAIPSAVPGRLRFRCSTRGRRAAGGRGRRHDVYGGEQRTAHAVGLNPHHHPTANAYAGTQGYDFTTATIFTGTAAANTRTGALSASDFLVL